MFPNLLGQKASRKLTEQDMANVIGTSRNTWMSKIKSGRFTPNECKALCVFFGKPFDYLFADEKDLPQKEDL